jgi:amidase
VRDAAALLDVLAGPSAGDPYAPPPPARPYAHEVTAEPGRLRIGWTARTADGSPGHPHCVAALDATLAALADLGHEVIETELPPFDEVTGAAIGTVFNAATAWIVGYWARELGRLPEPGELEPLTQCFWEMGREVRAGDYLLAIEALQRLTRRIAHAFRSYDVYVNPTMSEPPALIGEITSTADDPMRALARGGRTVAYSGVIANFTGQPAMSVPAGLSADGLPMGVHVLGRFGDEATLFQLASQLERARPWGDRAPPIANA